MGIGLILAGIPGPNSLSAAEMPIGMEPGDDGVARRMRHVSEYATRVSALDIVE